ncbi:MAG: uracil-DNA glycosylase [Bacillota bacterium]|nr:uracil-DNA glycosylase [Bacillota bacterium]MDP4169433.1 uracil-DNA glycosylase [Bacillota bacterium]
MKSQLQSGWEKRLKGEFEKEYFRRLSDFLEIEYKNHTVFPPREDIFNALKYTDFDQVKVVILGQDPYHGPNQAHGLSFSVQPEVKIPPSLKNIFKELHSDTGVNIPGHGCLARWAEQGVLLLNTVLTVRSGEANSHKGKGWETFTDKVISLLNDRKEPLVFILWGKPAQSKLSLINTEKHHIILSPHPSPLSARHGFFGSRPFSKTNHYLRQRNEREINWSIPD